MGRKTETIIKTSVTDDLTGNDVAESDATDYPFAFGEVSGVVTLSAESFAKINALPEFAALLSAATEYAANAPKTNGARVAKSYAGNAHAWEVRAATAPHGLSDAGSGGTIKNEAATKFAEFVNAGTWSVIGSKSKPEDGTEAAKTLAANLAATKPAPAKR